MIEIEIYHERALQCSDQLYRSSQQIASMNSPQMLEHGTIIKAADDFFEIVHQKPIVRIENRNEDRPQHLVQEVYVKSITEGVR